MSNKSHRSSTPAWAKDGYQNLSEKQSRDRRLWVIFGAAVAVVLVVVAIIAVVAGGGDDTTATDSTTIQETRAVDVMSGPNLDLYDDSLATDPAVGKSAPQVSGSTLDGQFITTSPQNGNYKMIVFVAHWCPHCQREVPRLVDWAASGEVPDNLDVMAVSTGIDKTRGNYPPSAWLAKEAWPFPVMADDANSTAASAYGLTSFPYFVVVSPEGKVLVRNSGEIEITALNEMLSTAMGSTN